MQLSPTEISDLIKKRIEGSDLSAEAKTEGTIVAVTDGIVRIHGLSDVMAGEMIEFPNNTYGLAVVNNSDIIFLYFSYQFFNSFVMSIFINFLFQNHFCAFYY